MKRSPYIDMTPLLAELNDEQRSAVTYLGGPLLVLAGAGTGKTRVITTRIANLLTHSVEPQSIVAVSFTRKAGNEMKTRLGELIGDAAHAMRVSTFHSLGLAILREQHSLARLNRGFGVCDTNLQVKLVEHVLRNVEQQYRPGHDLEESDVRAVIRGISLAKNCGHEPGSLKSTDCPDEQLIGIVLEAYNAELQRRQLVDLDDMIRLPVQILESNATARRLYQERYQHLLVDEFQDSNLLQNRLMRCLLGREQNICVVGDDDQSIYGFRGAKRDLILGFEREYPGAKVVKLAANYRCSREIIGVANAVIKESVGRYPKQLVAANGSSVPVRFMQASDAMCERRFIAADICEKRREEGRELSDFAVLVRVSREAAETQEELERNGVPCGREASGVHVMTLHASKGLEFPVVYVPGVEEDTLPHWNAKKDGENAIEEERRLFYVGVTRAGQRLTLSSSNRRGRHLRQPSRFAAGLIRKQLVQHQELVN